MASQSASNGPRRCCWIAGRTLDDVIRLDPDAFEQRPEGHAVDKHCPNLVYVPHDARADVFRLEMSWTRAGRPLIGLNANPVDFR